MIQGLGASWVGAWRTHRVLAGATLAFLVLLGVASLLLLGDGRQAAGQYVWIKPMKFAASSAIYCGTLLGLVGSVVRPAWGLRRAGSVVGLVLVLDVLIVGLQAARGTSSHFNVSTPLNAGLWATLGLSILVLLVASIVFTVAFWRSPVADRAWGWALRLGMAASVAGAMLGQLMTSPTAAQRATLAAAGQSAAIGGHTVGAADGGAGLPGIGWSRDHGDLRIPHFFGLHALQAIPLLCLVAFRLCRPSHEATRLALVMVVAASYAALVTLLTVQALSGRPLLVVDGPVLMAVVGWTLVTGLGVLLAVGSERFQVPTATGIVVGA